MGGSVTFNLNMLPPGNYEARLAYRSNWQCVRARAPLQIVGNFLHVKSSYSTTETILISYAVEQKYEGIYIELVGEGAACKKPSMKAASGVSKPASGGCRLKVQANHRHGTVKVKPAMLREAQYMVRLVNGTSNEILSNDTFSLFTHMSGFAISYDPDECTKSEGMFGECDAADVTAISVEHPAYDNGLRGYWCWLSGDQKGIMGYTQIWQVNHAAYKDKPVPSKCKIDPSMDPTEKKNSPERVAKRVNENSMKASAQHMAENMEKNALSERELKVESEVSEKNAQHERRIAERDSKHSELIDKKDYVEQQAKADTLRSQKDAAESSKKVIERSNESFEKAAGQITMARKERTAKLLEGADESKKKMGQIEQTLEMKNLKSSQQEATAKQVLVQKEANNKEELKSKAAEKQSAIAAETKVKAEKLSALVKAEEKIDKIQETVNAVAGREVATKVFKGDSHKKAKKAEEQHEKKVAKNPRLLFDFDTSKISETRININAMAEIQILGAKFAIGVQMLMNGGQFSYKYWFNYLNILLFKVHIYTAYNPLPFFIKPPMGFKLQLQTAGIDQIFKKIVQGMKDLVKAFNEKMDAAMNALESAKNSCYKMHPPTWKQKQHERGLASENRAAAAKRDALKATTKARDMETANMQANTARKAREHALALEKSASEFSEKNEGTQKNNVMQHALKLETQKRKDALLHRKMIEEQLALNKQQTVELTKKNNEKDSELTMKTSKDSSVLSEASTKKQNIHDAATSKEKLGKELISAKENEQKAEASSTESSSKNKRLIVAIAEAQRHYTSMELKQKDSLKKEIQGEEAAQKQALVNAEIHVKSVKLEEKRKVATVLHREEELDMKERVQKQVTAQAENDMAAVQHKVGSSLRNFKKTIRRTGDVISQVKCEVYKTTRRLKRSGNYVRTIANNAKAMFFSVPCTDHDTQCFTAQFLMSNITLSYDTFAFEVDRILMNFEELNYGCSDIELNGIIEMSNVEEAAIFGVQDDCSIYARMNSSKAMWKVMPNSSCVKSIGFTSNGRMLGVKDDGSLVQKRDRSATSKWESAPLATGAPALQSVMGKSRDGSILGVSKDGRLFKSRDLKSNWHEVSTRGRIDVRGQRSSINLRSVTYGPSHNGVNKRLFGVGDDDGCVYHKGDSGYWEILRTETNMKGVCKMRSVTYRHYRKGLGLFALVGWDGYLYEMSVSPLGPDDVTDPAFIPSLPGCWYRSLSGCPLNPGSTLWTKVPPAVARQVGARVSTLYRSEKPQILLSARSGVKNIVQNEGRSVLHRIPSSIDAKGNKVPNCNICPGVDVCANVQIRVNVEVGFEHGSEVGAPEFECSKIVGVPEVLQNKRDGTMYVVERTQMSKETCLRTLHILQAQCFKSGHGDVQVHHNGAVKLKINLASEKAAKKKADASAAKESKTKHDLDIDEKATKATVETAVKSKKNTEEKKAKNANEERVIKTSEHEANAKEEDRSAANKVENDEKSREQQEKETVIKQQAQHEVNKKKEHEKTEIKEKADMKNEDKEKLKKLNKETEGFRLADIASRRHRPGRILLRDWRRRTVKQIRNRKPELLRESTSALTTLIVALPTPRTRSYKFGSLHKIKGSCCSQMASFNDLSAGEVMNRRIQKKIRLYTDKWKMILNSKVQIKDLKAGALEANYYVQSLPRVGALGLYSLLGKQSSNVLREAKMVHAHTDLMLTELEKGWHSIRDMISTGKLEPGEPGAHAYKKTLNLFIESEATIRVSKKSANILELDRKERDQLKKQAQLKVKCEMSQYASCQVVKSMECADGIYPIQNSTDDEPKARACKDGIAYHADGCPYGWISANGWCYRVFPKSYGNTAIPKHKRDMTIVDESFVDFAAAKKHCHEHSSLFETDVDDIDPLLNIRSWRYTANKDEKTDERLLWVGRFHGFSFLENEAPKDRLHKLPTGNDGEPNCSACPPFNLCAKMEVMDDPETHFEVGPHLTGEVLNPELQSAIQAAKKAATSLRSLEETLSHNEELLEQARLHVKNYKNMVAVMPNDNAKSQTALSRAQASLDDATREQKLRESIIRTTKRDIESSAVQSKMLDSMAATLALKYVKSNSKTAPGSFKYGGNGKEYTCANIGDWNVTRVVKNRKTSATYLVEDVLRLQKEKTRTLEHAVLDGDGRIQPYNESFRTMAVCKRRPNKSVVTAAVAACLSRTNNYTCPHGTAVSASLREAVGGCSDCFAVSFSDPHMLNQISIQATTGIHKAPEIEISVLSRGNEVCPSLLIDFALITPHILTIKISDHAFFHRPSTL